MTAPDYPLLALGSYETYQLAHIATYIAERLSRHHRSGRGPAGRAARVEAVRDLAGAAVALSNATGSSIPDHDLPRPLDRDTFRAARELLATGPRTAEVVSLAGAGQSGFAVVGHVPGVGAVGARVATTDIADALRVHFLTQPAAELTAWAVTQGPQRVPALPSQVDLAAFVEHLDPARHGDRAVARNMRGHSRRTDAAIRGRFANVDLDAPAVLVPPVTSPAAPPAVVTPSGAEPRRTPRPRRPAIQDMSRSRTGLRRPVRHSRADHRTTATPTVPNTSAGP